MWVGSSKSSGDEEKDRIGYRGEVTDRSLRLGSGHMFEHLDAGHQVVGTLRIRYRADTAVFSHVRANISDRVSRDIYTVGLDTPVPERLHEHTKGAPCISGPSGATSCG